MKQLLFALQAYKMAMSFTNKHNLWVYYIAPAIINMLIFSGLAYLFFIFGNSISLWLESFLPTRSLDNTWLTIIDIFLRGFIYVFLLLFYLKTYRFVMLILLSPALSMLSEKVQELSQNTTPRPFNISQLLHDILRGIKISFRNLFIEIAFTLLLSVIGIIFGFLSPITTVCIIIIESYFLGFSMIDYRNEFMQISASNSQKMIWKYKGFAVGIGFFCTLMLFIPVLGVLVAPLLAVTAAGLGINILESEGNFYQNK